jgi:IS1 family transposase
VDVREKKKLPRLAEGETGEDGSLWVWIAFAAQQRLILALVVGPRTQGSANELIRRTASVLIGRLPIFASDGLDHYGVALFDRWHLEVPQPRTGRPGRPRHPAKATVAELRYVQLVKHREARRLVSVTKRVIHGEAADIDPRQITTSLIERLNLTLRQENAVLRRKTLAFAKDEQDLHAHLALYVAYYHFVRPHLSLRRALPSPTPVHGRVLRKWERRTPAMAAGITEQVWSLRELLAFQSAITSID